MNEKNYGLNLELEKAHQKETDWLLGAAPVKCIALIPHGERDVYLPKGERQNIGEEKMDCASRAPLNILETKFYWLLKNNLLPLEHNHWLINNAYVDAETKRIEFSDAFVAINAKTTREGASLIAPLEAIRKQGVIPKSLLPQASTFEEHHDPNRITDAMRKMGEEFVVRFTINYERVAESQFADLLDEDIFDVGGYAWPNPINGEYPKTGATPNHAFVIYKKPTYFAFDNYTDPVDGDFTKKLASNYDLIDFGYRLIISLKPVKKKESIVAVIIAWLKSLFDYNESTK